MSLNRDRFPGLNDGWARFDAPSGTQPVDAAIEAMTVYMSGGDFANLRYVFRASKRSEAVMADARVALAELFGADPDGVVFAQSMTALAWRVAGAAARTLTSGDEVICTRLDHDANIKPWQVACERSGASLRMVDIDRRTLDLVPSAVAEHMTERTRWVAVTAASNATGAVPDVAAIARAARSAGARTVMDAVHAAPHIPVRLDEICCDVLLTSAYKWFGPHVGALIGDPRLLEELGIDVLSAAAQHGPQRWDLGTPPLEAVAGAAAAARYMLDTGYEAIIGHEALLADALVKGLGEIDGVAVHGRPSRRVPTVLFEVEKRSATDVATELAEDRIAVGHGHFYALEVADALGLGSEGAVRAGAVHYTGVHEIERLVTAVAAVAAVRAN